MRFQKGFDFMKPLTNEEKRIFRTLLFKHQDGLAITNTIATLKKKGIFDIFENKHKITIKEIAEYFPLLNLGYVNVALRSLASQGIFEYKVSGASISIKSTPKFQLLHKYIPLYLIFSEVYKEQLTLLKTENNGSFLISDLLILLSKKLKEIRLENTDDAYYQDEVLIHLEGVLLLPVLVHLNFNNDTEGISSMKSISENEKLQIFLENLLLLKDGKLTKKGQFLFDKSYAYGVTTSYLPVMTNVEDYLNGNLHRILSVMQMETNNMFSEQLMFGVVEVLILHILGELMRYYLIFLINHLKNNRRELLMLGVETGRY